MSYLVERLKSGLHGLEYIVLGGCEHDKRCLEAAYRIEELEGANHKRKAMDAQMLMNAVESGNPNYPVLVRTLQDKIRELEHKLLEKQDAGGMG